MSVTIQTTKNDTTARLRSGPDASGTLTSGSEVFAHAPAVYRRELRFGASKTDGSTSRPDAATYLSLACNEPDVDDDDIHVRAYLSRLWSEDWGSDGDSVYDAL
jgi:hypothetical protein